MTTDLAGKRALITGAAAGIGRATATLFAQQGAEVFGLDRRWDSTVRGITRLDGDVTSDADVQAAVANAAGDRGLDILVANAGAVLVDEWLTGDLTEWRNILEVNVMGVMRCFQAAGTNMVEHGRGGRLLATASLAGLRAEPVIAAYGASKAAVVSLVQSAALAFAPHAITVNAVAPGEVDTGMLRQGVATLAGLRDFSADPLELAAAGTPVGRIGQPGDIATAFAFLASDSAAYITGITMPIDGGRLLV